MVPNEALQYQGIVRLLLHFGWKWVGLMTMDNDAGEHFMKVLEPMLSRHGICSAFTDKTANRYGIPNLDDLINLIPNLFPAFLESKANAILHAFLYSFNNSCGEEVKFNEEGELAARFDITNLVTFPNDSFVRVKVGRLDPATASGVHFIIEEDQIEWHEDLTEGQQATEMMERERETPLISARMMQTALLMLLPDIAGQVYSATCKGNAPEQVPQEWYQPGELLIGGMASHIHYILPRYLYKKHPSQDRIKDILL
ncbi:hypothetical protein lerEdw1_015985 [Lerista edwardsae]|nr:hypothetical protein lerEdw1_015985 [Lerista edwardsae]